MYNSQYFAVQRNEVLPHGLVVNRTNGKKDSRMAVEVCFRHITDDINQE
jgi:hypothetical protein